MNDPILCAWIGEMYTYLQSYTGLSSKEIVKKYPFKDMYIKSKGLHDLAPKYAVEKLVGKVNYGFLKQII